VLPAGHQLGRIYPATGDHPTTWSAFRTWGSTTSRFDHHPHPPGNHSRHGVLYVAPHWKGTTRSRQPVLRTCLAEVFRDGRVVELSRDGAYFALFETTEPLRLLDVADTLWVTAAGGNAAISSGRHDDSRAWARAIWRTYRDVDGILYGCSNIPPARSVVLFERARRAMPAAPSLNRPLADPALRGAIERFATDLALDLVP
jgi:hypothetical protein